MPWNDQWANRRPYTRLCKGSFLCFSISLLFLYFILSFLFFSLSPNFVCSVGFKLKIRVQNTFFQELTTSCRWNRPHLITPTFHEFKLIRIFEPPYAQAPAPCVTHEPLAITAIDGLPFNNRVTTLRLFRMTQSTGLPSFLSLACRLSVASHF